MQNQEKYVHRLQPLTTMEVSRILKGLGMPLSQPSVFRRLKRLRREGGILRNTVDIDYDKLGFQTRFILKLKVNPIFYDHIARDKLVFMKEITLKIRQKAHFFKGGRDAVDKLIAIYNNVVRYEVSTCRNQSIPH